MGRNAPGFDALLQRAFRYELPVGDYPGAVYGSPSLLARFLYLYKMCRRQL